MNKTKVLYHKNCTDGFGAALAVHCHLYEQGKLDEAEFIPVQYGEAPPDVTGDNVWIVDFSYPRETLLEMKEKANSIIVIDHHKTAKDQLADLDFCVFDIAKSGCVLTWEYLFPYLEVPELLLYLQDRDLWQWKLPHSQEVSAAIRSHPFNFELWEGWMTDKGLERLRKEGVAILRYQNQQVKMALSKEVERYVIGGHEVPVINTTTLISEIVGELAKGEAFAAGYFDTHDKRVFSLRSNSLGLDVGQIAKQYGGGGHPRSAGFTVDKPQLFQGVYGVEERARKTDELIEINKELLRRLPDGKASQTNQSTKSKTPS